MCFNLFKTDCMYYSSKNTETKYKCTNDQYSAENSTFNAPLPIAGSVCKIMLTYP